MAKTHHIFKHQDGVALNTLAIGFSLLGHGLGWAACFSKQWLLNTLCTLLLAESLVISAYLVHEFCHYNLMRTLAANRATANLMLWPAGHAIAPAKTLKVSLVQSAFRFWPPYKILFSAHQ